MSRPLDPLLGRLPIRTASAALAVALLLPAAAVAQAPDTIEGDGRDERAGGDAIVEEARAFMDGYAADLLTGEPDAIAARYSRRGAYLVLPGIRSMVPHEEIVGMYREGGPAPDVFEWQDLAFEPVGEDAVMVVGAFRWESAGDDDGMLGTYTSLLVREDGELRIRLENESFDNLPPAECEGRPEPCDLPLDEAALARYAGEYETPGEEGLTRVYVEDGHLVAQRPGGPPARLLHEGGHAFRIAAAPSVRIVFDGGGERATSYVAFTGTVHTRATRAR